MAINYVEGSPADFLPPYIEKSVYPVYPELYKKVIINV